MQNNKKKFAVFDVDGTIFRSSLLIELAEELIRAGVFPKTARNIYEGPHKKWLDRKDSYDKYIMAVVAAFDHHIRDVREKDFVRVVDHVVELHRNRVYRYTRDLVKSLKKQGYFLLAISHSPKYVVGRFGIRMGFDKVYGRLLELDPKTSRFTGRGLHLDLILDKAKALARAIEKENLTLRGSVGVGDTESDIPILQMVNRPICFNPNSALYRIAKRKGWEVVVERKDVLYKLKTKK